MAACPDRVLWSQRNRWRGYHWDFVVIFRSLRQMEAGAKFLPASSRSKLARQFFPASSRSVLARRFLSASFRSVLASFSRSVTLQIWQSVAVLLVHLVRAVALVSRQGKQTFSAKAIGASAWLALEVLTSVLGWRHVVVCRGCRHCLSSGGATGLGTKLLQERSWPRSAPHPARPAHRRLALLSPSIVTKAVILQELVLRALCSVLPLVTRLQLIVVHPIAA